MKLDKFEEINYPNAILSGYLINRRGQIYSKARDNIMTPHCRPFGNVYDIQLMNDVDEEIHCYAVHRLVASTFLPNPDNCFNVVFWSLTLDSKGCIDPSEKNILWHKAKKISPLQRKALVKIRGDK